MTLRRRDFIASAAGTLAACSQVPVPPSEEEPEALDVVAVPYEMKGFSWVVDDALAGMPRPGAHAELEADFRFLADQKIDLLVSLTEAGVDEDEAEAFGVDVLHLPVKDFGAPTLDQLCTFTKVAREHLAAGRRVGVHCGAGLGRTGTFLAAYFVGQGMTAEAAIAHVRALRPGSIETKAQEAILAELEITPCP